MMKNILAVVLLCSVAAAQSGTSIAPQTPGSGAGPTPAISLVAPGSAISGSIPHGAATADILPLSLPDAMARGLRYNLALTNADLNIRGTSASRLRALSALMPNLSAQASDTTQQMNLKALGFGGFPGIPAIIPPFNVMDLRAALTQAVMDYSAIQRYRAGGADLSAARRSLQNTRDLVALAVVSLYLQSITASSRIDAAQANVETANALYHQAVDQKKAGVVPGIDVLRAQVELQAEQQQLIFYRKEFEKRKLDLARAIGLPAGQAFRLTDPVPYTPPPPIALDEALARAYDARPDYLALREQVRSAELLRKAAGGQRLPSIVFDGNYGTIGPRFNDNHGTFLVTGAIRVPIFDGGRIAADVEQADVLLSGRRAELEDLRGRIDYDVRTAFLDLNAAADQVKVAESNRILAQQELEQARDRFAAGVSNSVEVVQGQQAVATAQENFINALFAYNLGKASLARAVGSTETNILKYLNTGTIGTGGARK